jgi:hypothetical protein
MPRRHRKMKGGFLESLGSTLSGWGSSISQSASDAYNKTKNATSSAYSSATTPTSTTSYTPTSTSTTTTSYTPTSTTSYTPSGAYGGKKGKSRKMRGGYSNNNASTGLAANASPISGIKSAEPHNWVGGKKSRKNKRRTRSKK